MNNKIILGLASLAFLVSTTNVVAQEKQDGITMVEQDISALQSKQKSLEYNVLELTRKSKDVDYQIVNLKADNDSLQQKVDSLEDVCKGISSVQKADKDTLSTQIGKTKSDVQASLSNRTVWGIGIAVVLLIAIAALAYWLLKNFKHGSTSIDEVRKAQEALEQAQRKMHEESIKIDNKLIEIAEQQLAAQKTTDSPKSANSEKDHSLTLKVADELTRIELNLSRMDSSTRGYKPLLKAVQRIKDNFSANGYEIVDMLGKPYVAGMKAAVTFVTDETLEEDKQIITRIIKPQINYNGQMIQAAQIEVSQAE